MKAAWADWPHTATACRTCMSLCRRMWADVQMCIRDRAEVLEQKLLREEVYAALMQLTDIQARRIYARFYLGMTVGEHPARTEEAGAVAGYGPIT